MAVRTRVCVYFFLGALLPAFASSIRPFRVPKNLFVQGTSPDTIPDGVSVIRPAREAEEPEFESPQEERAEDLHGRFRRESPVVQPRPETSFVSLSLYFKFVT